MGYGRIGLAVPDLAAAPGDTVSIASRAGDIIIALERPAKISARNLVTATVSEIHHVGPQVLVYTDVGERLIVDR